MSRDLAELAFSRSSKDGGGAIGNGGITYAFRWEAPMLAGRMMPPFLQVVVRDDGQVIQYMNTLDLEPSP